MADGFRLRADGPVYPFYYHPHNCGLRSAKRRTERTVELSLASAWLKHFESEHGSPVIEVGAVSPYYWPKRVETVVDPADKKCTVAKSIFDVDLTGKPVLCVSTIEHVGEGRYGLKENRQPLEAFEQIRTQATDFLITLPFGWEVKNPRSKSLFDHLLSGAWQKPDSNMRIYFLTRNRDESWGPSTEFRKYGGAEKPWANTLLVIEGGRSLL